MLAFLQRSLALILGILIVAVAWSAPQDTAFVRASLVALFMVAAYAAVLALEFALMHLQNGRDPTPRAAVRAVLRAWWHELLAAPKVFGWRQPWRSRSSPDMILADGDPAVTQELAEASGPPNHGSLGTARPVPSSVPVLLVHGFVCNRGLWLPWLLELRRRGVPYVAVDLEPVFGSIDAYAERIETAVTRLEAMRRGAPIVVAHSMGGLAVRAWWAQPGNLLRVRHLLTLGTPHHGTWLARFGLAANTRQMRMDSDWLRQLQATEASDWSTRCRRITCFYSHCDNIVFPARRACLAGADNRHLPGCAHVQMADHPAPRAELMRRLAAIDQSDADP